MYVDPGDNLDGFGQRFNQAFSARASGGAAVPFITVPDKLGDGSVLVGTTDVYATTVNNVAPEKLYHWPNPLTNLSNFTATNLTSGGSSNTFANSIAYDSVNSCLYICMANPNDVGGFYTITVMKVTVPGLVQSFLYNVQLESDAGFTPSLNSSICTDGTNIWLIGDTNDTNSTVYRHTVAGVLVNSLQLPNPAVGTNPQAQKGSVILLGGDGFLYVAGSSGNSGAQTTGFAGRVATDLSSATTIQTPGMQSTNDDAVLIGSNLWIGSETVATPGRLMRIAKDMSSATAVTLGNGAGWVDGMAYDGTNLWVLQVNDPSVGTLCKFDPVGLTVLKNITLSVTHPNEIILMNSNLSAYINTFQTNSAVTVQPLS